MVFLIASNVSCNLFLYRYLERRTENNIARSEADKMKDRKRNLVPARIGMMNIFLYVVAMALFMFAYSFKSDSLDSGTRAFMIAAYALGRVKHEKSQLGITATCFFGTILYGETEFTVLLKL